MNILAEIVIGIACGLTVAGGVFAVIVIIGIVPRMAQMSGGEKHIMLYETIIILGGVLGNILDIYEFPIYMGAFFGHVFLIIAGLSMGIFVGCLVMSLAETLKALPVISRRIHLAVGLQYLIFALAAGKLAGSLAYFWYRMASLG